MLAQALDIAAKLKDGGHPKQEWDFYAIKRSAIIPKCNPYLPSAAHIKTHERHKKTLTDYGNQSIKTRKVVVVTRNPFDTLLSSLNYQRIAAKEQGRVTDSIRLTIASLCPSYKIPEGLDAFIESFNIDNLLKEKLLDSCLDNFARNGTVIDLFYNMSGPWALFRESYKHSTLPIHAIRYEDLVNRSNTIDEQNRLQAIDDLADYLESDRGILRKAFEIQSSNVASEKKQGSMFFSKAQHGYFVNYFSRDSVEHFVDMYYSCLKDLGYENLSLEYVS